MWCYALAMVGIVGVAEMLGLGGLPAPSVAVENVLFIVLLLALIATALRNSVRR